MPETVCVFCHPKDESVLWSDARCRVLQVTDANFAGFCRVVWNEHVTEFTDLDEPSRAHVMMVVATLERALRELLAPDKMNLASLGNMVRHLHWHVIPRYQDDSHFPGPIWATAQRPGAKRSLPLDFAAGVKQALDALR